MSVLEVDHLYTAASCNRHQNSLDFGVHLIVYASCHSLVIYDFKKCLVKNVLCEHKSQVNTVHWIVKDKSFTSSSNDNSVIIWESMECEPFNFKPTLRLTGHQSSVISSFSFLLPSNHFLRNDGRFLILSATNNQLFYIWIDDVQIIEEKTDFFIFDCKIIENRESWFMKNMIILLAASDSCIHVQSLDESKSLNKLCKLAGHEDWVRSVDYIYFEDSLFIASGAQDNFIRVWRLTETDREKSSFYERYFNVEGKLIMYTSETVLIGHEEWIYSVKYIQNGNVLRLLSSSMDKAMVLWEKPKDNNELWIEKMRVGEVGGNSLGFLGSSSSSDGNIIVGHSFNGALHLWNYQESSDSWQPGVIIGGHFSDVKDIVWDPLGRYLLSCSLDETSRLHAAWNANNSWHEINRPQIHGYEINCIAMINPLMFVSGADEKVLRIFHATKCFVRSIEYISKYEIGSGDELAEFATVPALGLSNKAIFDEKIEADSFFKAVVLEKPPTEDNLLQNTLWPEIQKLYGHVYEIFAVAVNNEGTIIASASKATKQEYASIILWDVKNNFKQMQQLCFHQLTVTQIRFSPNDKYLLTVSRDRTWCLYEFNDFDFRRVAFSDKKTGVHSRIIWDTAWTPDTSYFVTVSRDKKAVCWSLDNTSNEFSVKACSEYSECDSITSVDIDSKMHNDSDNSYLIAFGLENGQVHLFLWNLNKGWNVLKTLNHCHHLTVSRVRFAPNSSDEETKLATCSSDKMVRVFNIRFIKH